MRLQVLTLSLISMLAGSAYAQTTPAPAVDAGPAIQGNSDPAMPMKPKKMHMKKHMKKHMKHMHKKMM